MEKMQRIKAGFETLKTDSAITAKALANVEKWLTGEVYQPYIPYMDYLIETENWNMLLDCFWRMMPFGTGGRRGPVGAGPNRINPYTISLSVQGHCQYLRDVLKLTGDISVVVAHDVRQFFDLRGIYTGVEGALFEITSLDMAKISAMTYAANGIKAYVVGPLEDGDGVRKTTDRYISTPELSFLIREYGAAGGLNISASHNHPDDNGGKFYNRYGGQEIPPDDEALLKVVEQVTDVKTMDYNEAVKNGWIEFVSQEVHQKYIDLNTSLIQTESRSAKVGYTPLCGTGMTTVYEALTTVGFNVVTVAEQAKYDGSFHSVRYRIGNPEVPDSMDLLEKTALENQCDVGFSTDPDADRLGMLAKTQGGDFVFVNGNEIGVLLVQSIISSKKKAGTLKEKGIFANTLVTSSLQRAVAAGYGLQMVGDLMVGFKYIGDVLRCLEEGGVFPATPKEGKDSVSGSPDDYVFGCEESHGYLVTPHVRDKDACGAAIHLAGLVSELKDQGKTIDSYLRDIYRVYGYHRNVLRSLVMEGIEGLNRIRKIQDVLRKNPPSEIAGLKVINFVDNHIVGGPLQSSTDEASRNVLLYELDGGNGVTIRLVVRPSGTEPKTKIYVEVPSTKKLGGNLDTVSAEALASYTDVELDAIIAETDARATQIGNAFIKYCLGSEVLGDAFGEVPEESLLVSDLVTVDNKIALCVDVMPALAKRLADGQEGSEWLTERLKPFGEDAVGMVKDAAKAWINRTENDMSENNKEKALALFK
ncbi:MAG: phospho-sugar mutase [Deltaproteobacteria bacterium]|nr:phospho-sugar mutase [Deltaproteobacteria bacterium]MBN2671723.1 phospho-sugar mutase [Deltaproteobacteria bacterium]